MKSLLRNSAVTTLLGWLIWAYMVACIRTMRWRVEGIDNLETGWTGSRGTVVAAWHHTILILPAVWSRHARHWPKRSPGTAMLISLSRDGEAVAEAITHLGLESVRGSASNKRKRKDKGGAAALADAISRLRKGGVVCITPDGPRGPGEQVQDGPLILAQRSGAEIVPYALKAKPVWRLKTWDRFMIPFPFTRAAMVLGAPISASRDSDTPALKAELQSALDAASQRATELAGSQN